MPVSRGGRGRKSLGSKWTTMSLDPDTAKEMYDALLARSNVETDAKKGLFDRVWDNPITDAFSTLLPGGQPLKEAAGAVGKAAGLVEEGEDNTLYGPAAGGLGRLFDVLSRGQYASAGVAQTALDRGREFSSTALSNILPIDAIRQGSAALADTFAEGSTLDQLAEANRTAIESVNTVTGGAPTTDLVNFLSKNDAAQKILQGNPDAPTAFGAALRGLTGREKKSYSQVLESQGVTNPAIQHGTGFALDVALDPTSVLGAGKAKESSKLKAIKEAILSDADAGTAKLQNLVSTPKTAKVVEAATEPKMIAHKEMKQLLLDEHNLEAPTRESAQALADELGYNMQVVDFLDPTAGKKARIADPDFDLGESIAGDINPATGEATLSTPVTEKGYFSLNVMGKPVLKNYRAYDLGRKAFGASLERPEKGWFKKAFVQSEQLPDDLHDSLRAIESARRSELDSRISEVQSVLKNVDPKHRETISFAIDNNKNLEHISLGKPIELPGGMQAETLEDVKQWVRGMHDRLFYAEAAQGVVEDIRVPNYVYRVPKKGTKAIPKGDTRSLQELIDNGFEPETDILNSLVHRIAKSERKLTRSDFHDHVDAAFGIPGSAVLPEHVAKYDLVKRSQGVYIPRQLQEALDYQDKIFTNDELAAQFMSGFDKVQQEWKFLATAANPGHHVRNTFSDVVMNAQDGVAPGDRVYAQAARILKNRHNMQLADVDPNFVPEGGVIPMAFKEGVEKSPMKIGKNRIPQDALYQAFVESGGKSGFQATELHRQAEKLAKTNPYSKFRTAMGGVAEQREDYVRLSHFLGVLKKDNRQLYKNGNWTQAGREAIEEAGKRVRKWNLDYGSLTPFERKYMRRMIPFYSFMRLNLPRQAELLFTKPGFMALYPKGQNLLQGAFGTDNGDDTLLPHWIRESAPFRLAKEGQERGGPLGWLLDKFGVEPGQQALFGGQGFFPIGDLDRISPLFSPEPVKDAFNQALNDVTPAIKMPVELGTGRSTFTGAEIGTGFDDYLKYAAGAIPAGRQAQTIFSGDSQGGFARYLTGVPIRGVTEDQMKGEFRRREDIINAVFRSEMNKEQALSSLPDDERRKFFRMMQGLNAGR